MTDNFEQTALITREPKTRVGRRCASELSGRGPTQIEAVAARSLPKSDSSGGRRFPGRDGLAREKHLEARGQLVHRGPFLATPAPGADTADGLAVVRAARVGALGPAATLCGPQRGEAHDENAVGVAA
jgi:hypothetical protein